MTDPANQSPVQGTSNTQLRPVAQNKTSQTSASQGRQYATQTNRANEGKVVLTTKDPINEYVRLSFQETEPKIKNLITNLKQKCETAESAQKEKFLKELKLMQDFFKVFKKAAVPPPHPNAPSQPPPHLRRLLPPPPRPTLPSPPPKAFETPAQNESSPELTASPTAASAPVFKADKAIKHMGNVLKETITTEETFQNQVTIAGERLEKLSQSTRDPEFKAVGSLYTDLSELSKKIISKLKLTERELKKLEGKSEKTKLKFQLKKLVSVLQSSEYKVYCETVERTIVNFDNMSNKLNKLEQSKSNKLAEVEKYRKSDANSNNLIALLITSVQRLPRHVLLTKDLIKDSTEAGFEKENEELNKVLNLIQKVTENINESTRMANFDKTANLKGLLKKLGNPLEVLKELSSLTKRFESNQKLYASKIKKVRQFIKEAVLSKDYRSAIKEGLKGNEITGPAKDRILFELEAIRPEVDKKMIRDFFGRFIFKSPSLKQLLKQQKGDKSKVLEELTELKAALNRNRHLSDKKKLKKVDQLIEECNRLT